MAEGLCFAVLAAGLLLAAPGRRGPIDPAARMERRRRWRRCCRQGLADYRALWWWSFRYEPWAVRWRHVALIEWFELLNERTPAPAAPRGTLVVATGHIGDVLQVIPLLRALRAGRPGEPLVALVGPWARSLLNEEPALDETVEWVPQLVQYQRGQPGLRASARAERDGLLRLRGRHFREVITVGPTEWHTWLLVRALRPARWVGVALRPPLFPALGGETVAPYDTTLYEAERIRRLLPGPERAPATLVWQRAAAARAAGLRKLAGLGWAEETNLVCLAPGGGWPGKLWPAERYGELGRWLVETHGCRVLVLGSAGEQALAATICAAIGARAVNLAGLTTLEESAGLLAAARLLVANDSGPLHLAAVMGTATLAFFGPTQPAQWAPPGPRHRVLRAAACSPQCVPWHTRATCLGQPPCLTTIPVSAAQQAIADLLGPAA